MKKSSPDLRESVIELCGVRIHNLTMSEAVERIEWLVSERRPAYVVTPNVDHLVRFQSDAEFRDAYRDAALALPDGFPLLWAARFLGRPLKEKISGSDLAPAQCRDMARRGRRLFFLGGRPGAADRARRRLERQYPGIRIVGTYCPPYGFERDPRENAGIVRRIRETSPDVVFLGLGTPKQEKWMHRHYREAGSPVMIGVGATIDFMAGVVRRAPFFMQRSGLEWLWRLALEPRRLWRRYLVEDPRFFWILLKHKLAHPASR